MMNHKHFTIILLSILHSSFLFCQQPEPGTPSIEPLPAEEEIYRVVEEMPRFPGCEDISGSARKKEECAKEAMLEYIYSNLIYPAEALKEGTEGMAVIHFIVWKDGTIRDIKVVRDPGSGIGEAAAQIVEGMKELNPAWRPGHQRGNPVCVKYVLPIKYKIDNEKLTEIYKNKPKWPDCKKVRDPRCTQRNIELFIKENQLYPEEARKNKTEGTVRVSFYIEKNGSLSEIKALNHLPDGLSEDAVEIFKWMNSEKIRWIPAKENGKSIRYLYEVDVKYDIAKWESGG